MEKILIVDDSVVSRKILRTQLEREGYTVHEATSGEKALEMVNQDNFSLITLDVHMPGMSGFEVGDKLIKIQEQKGSQNVIPLIFVTGNDSLEERERGFEVGACDFISKAQVPKGELVIAVNKHLRPTHEIEGSRVLLVDDSAVVRKAMQRTLGSMGVEPDIAESAKTALDMLGKPGVEYDLFIFDCEMPDMNGLELCQKVRTHLGIRDVPVIFLTGNVDRKMQLQCFQVGGTDYIQKPCIREELEARIRVHLGVVARSRMMTKLNSQLQRTNQALDRFASTAAHDLKSPLATITMAIERLEKKFASDDDPRTAKLLDMITRSADKMNKMIHQLLDYAKSEIKNSALPKVPLTTVFRDLLEDLASQLEQKQGKVNVSDALPGVRASEGALRSIFQNVLTNAIKYSSPERPPEINVTHELSGKEIVVAIADNGIGFDKAGVDPFAAFTRLVDDDSEVEGHGVGLSSVRETVEEMGGRIWADSEPGVGSTFYVSLPDSV